MIDPSRVHSRSLISIRQFAGVAGVCLTQAMGAQSARPGVIEGTVTDSVRKEPLIGATVRATPIGSGPDTTFATITDSRGRFRFERMMAGQYAVAFASTLLDSLRFGGPAREITVVAGLTTKVTLAMPSAATFRATACPETPFAPGTGALLGVVSDADTERPLAGAQVLLAWSASVLDPTNPSGVSEEHVAQTATTSAEGDYRFCGVPTGEWLVIQVQHAARAGAPLQLSIPDAVGVLVRDLSFSSGGARSLADAVLHASDDATALPPLSGMASLTGMIVAEGGRPVVGAQVSVLTTAAQARTDENGRFTLSGLPAGTFELEIRQIGYRSERRAIELRSGNMARHDARLERIVTLDSVKVIAQRVRFPEFEANKRRATHARFLNQADIDKVRDHATNVSDIVTQLVGWRISGFGINARVDNCDVAVDDSKEPLVQVEPGQATGGMLNRVRASDVGVMEFYPPRSYSAPTQFRGRCAIMIWTMSWANRRAARR